MNKNNHSFHFPSLLLKAALATAAAQWTGLQCAEDGGVSVVYDDTMTCAAMVDFFSSTVKHAVVPRSDDYESWSGFCDLAVDFENIKQEPRQICYCRTNMCNERIRLHLIGEKSQFADILSRFEKKSGSEVLSIASTENNSEKTKLDGSNVKGCPSLWTYTISCTFVAFTVFMIGNAVLVGAFIGDKIEQRLKLLLAEEFTV